MQADCITVQERKYYILFCLLLGEVKKWSSVAPILIDIEPLPFTSVKVYLLDVPRRGDWIMQWWWLAMGQRTGRTTGWSRTPGTPTGVRREEGFIRIKRGVTMCGIAKEIVVISVV